ncbi:hypothetical protein [Rhodococcus sp. 1168]|nr:hypothetical protein [Rhodococcus sp. 1168]
MKGPQATEWLERIGLPARLIDANRNTILTSQWPVGIAPPTESTPEEN